MAEGIEAEAPLNLSRDANRLLIAFFKMRADGHTTVTADVFTAAGLTYDRGRVAVRELIDADLVRETGNFG